MALWTCLGCTAAYSVGAPRCPQCGGTDRAEEGQDMPKITVHGGPSIAGTDEPEPTEGSDRPSAGSSSETSSPREPSSPPKSGPGRRSRARTTANPSARGQTDGSTAAGTAGDPTASEEDDQA